MADLYSHVALYEKVAFKSTSAEPAAGDETGPFGPKGDQSICPAGR